MPTFDFTSPDGKKYSVDGPAGATKEQAFEILQSQINAPSAPRDAKAVIDSIPNERSASRVEPMAPQRQDTMGERAFGLAEPIISMGTGAVGGIVGSIAGVGKTLLSGKLGTQEGIREGDKFGGDIANAMTYQPRTQTGSRIAQLAGEAMHNSGIVGIPIPELQALSRGASSSMSSLRGLAGPSAEAMTAQDAAAAAGGGRLRDLMRAPKPAMAGGGAAETAETTLRAQRFANMRAPMKPTKGILTRSIDDVQFEREAAKRPEGKGLDNRFAELNKGMEQHMDALVEETGAQASSSRAAGKAVTSALEAKQNAKKTEIRKAYNEARVKGELADEIDMTALTDFIAKNKGKDRLAPIISTIESELKQNAKITGGGVDALMNPTQKKTVMTLGASEDLRQAINKLTEPGTPNVVFGKEARNIIDAATEGKGGASYQQARRLYENYANEFKNRDIIDKMLRTKRGTKDRAVAYEDVADHVLMNGSLDDMKHVFRVLEAHPKGTAPEIVAAGKQAAAELRGAAAAKLKERMFSNAGADSSGRVVGSEAQIKRIVAELDKDGKLEALFGTKGAEEIRDTVQVATDLYSTPKGTVNTSNTASAMEKVLDRMSGTFGGTPVVGHAIKYGAKKLESRNYSKRVDAALNPEPRSTGQTIRELSRGD